MRILCFFLLLAMLPFTVTAQGNPDPVTSDTYLNVYKKLRRTLKPLGYPVGRAGNAAYVIDQYVLSYDDPNAATQMQRDVQTLKRQFGARNVKQLATCGCGKRQITAVHIRGLGGEERGKRGREHVASTLGKEEVAPNYYLNPDREHIASRSKIAGSLPPNFSVLSSGKPAAPVNIAVLDSGLDYIYQQPNHPQGGARTFLWENPAPNDPKDPFCFNDDLIGWDFVNNDNSPFDDHSHGTHITSRIAIQLNTYAPDVNYRFMPLKMLDENGVGNSFNAACAVLYAAENGADIIQASWGFYGEDDPILRAAFKFAESKKVTTIGSAGNERLDLAEFAHYPSSYALEGPPKERLHSHLFISAARTPSVVWPLSNIRLEAATPGNAGGFLIAAGGGNYGYIPVHLAPPNGSVGFVKSGTSVAAPYAAALAADHRHKHPAADGVWTRNAVLQAVMNQGLQGTFNANGSSYPFFFFNWVNVP
ncbi:MAG: S8 family serine peptidase [Bacteroidota bacterium]